MAASLSAPVLIGIFLLAAGVVWYAGIWLARATDVLAVRWGLGEALGGLIVLAIVTNLPEIAITASGAWRGQLEVAVGNLLGGIAVQTVVLVLLDARGRGTPLMARAASSALVVEGVLVMLVLAVVVMGAQLPARFAWHGVFPPDFLLAGMWVAGLLFINRLRRSSDEQPTETKPHGHSRRHRAERAKAGKHSTGRYVAILVAGGLATLAGGVALEGSGGALAERWGMGGAVFGATILAAATSLPEISTGWAAVGLGDDRMAISDIFGGNAFLPVLFAEASLISGRAVLPSAKTTDLYLAALGIVLTAVYVAALVLRPRRRVAGIGVDSLVVLALYGLGVAGLLAF